MSKKLIDKLQEQVATKGIVLENERQDLLRLDDEQKDQQGACMELQPLVSSQILPTLAITLEEARERIRMLQTFVAEMMVEGQDYGKIPGCQKPTLLKPGAEKLCDIFGFSKEVEVINRLEDWEKGIFHFEVKVRLTSKRTGFVEAEGIGSCNTWEKKYASQDPYTLVNTIMKMAKKRALVDAVLSATRSSNLFTQDLEDLRVLSSIRSKETKDEPITKPQILKIQRLGKALNFSKDDAQLLLKKDFGVEHTFALSKSQATQLIRHLLSMQEAS
ncbi:hypothetical protein [Anoxynatronum sibiricum]|uniref:Uncharacterized protein n=1 Tax=Anoxynatronum sibiricum TaxID=210623 RepID=A0ABU9VX50_9CLOT